MFIGFRLSALSSIAPPLSGSLCWSTDELIWGASNTLTWG